ncbi:MAG: monofunctional biosynthetic peptidoglycan transglycosylase [Pseudomonadota bacterium]
MAARRRRSRRRARGRIAKGLRGLAAAVLAVVGVGLLWVLAYRWVDPPTTLYIERERARLGAVSHAGARLAAVPDLARLAFPAAEDARFCAHWGIDLEAVRAALEDERRLRGGSTLTQQVAKNAFLWPGRTWLRKGVEAGVALAIEALWPKRRILEVYLNVAEMGEGVFGLEAAARAYFSVGAEGLSPRQAALIAAGLPTPARSDPARPSAYLARRAAAIERGAETLLADGRGACVL